MPPEKQLRDGFLDGLRFMAGFMVLAFHFGFRGYAEGGFLSLEFPELSPIVRYGYLGVQLFFMISGYVILWSIKSRTLIYFAAHRLIRLYPTFWLCLAFTLLVERLTNPAGFHLNLSATLANLTMVPTWLGYGAIDGSYWSLAIELQFYMVVGASVWAFGYKSLGNVLLASLLVAYVYPVLYFSLFFAYFGIGAACYLLHSEGFRLNYFALLVGSLSIALQTCQWEALNLVPYYHARLDPRVCATTVALEALLVFSSYWINPMMGRRVSQSSIYLGGVTYPLYLIHQFAGYSIMNRYSTVTNRWLVMCVTTLVMVAFSSLIYVYFDVPIRAKLRRFVNLKLAKESCPAILVSSVPD